VCARFCYITIFMHVSDLEAFLCSCFEFYCFIVCLCVYL